MKPIHKYHRIHTFSVESHHNKPVSFKINHLKTDQDDSKRWHKKSPEYFQSLRDQLLQDRERIIFKLDPELTTLTAQNQIQQISRFKRNKQILNEKRSLSCPNLQVPKLSNFIQTKGRKLQRSTSCTCSECAINNIKVKFAKCKSIQHLQVLPRNHYCAQHLKVAIRRRFRKIVICVQIVLYYKKNISKIQKKRLKRLSMKSQTMTAVQRTVPQEKITLLETPNLQSETESEASPVQQKVENKTLHLQPYFRNQANNKTLTQFILHKEKKINDDSKLIQLNVVEERKQLTPQDRAIFESLQQFQKNQVLKKKSTSISRLPPTIRDENVDKYAGIKTQSSSNYRAKSGYFKSQYQSNQAQDSGILYLNKNSFSNNTNQFTQISQQSQRNKEFRIFSDLRKGIQSQDKSRERIVSRNTTLEGLNKPRVYQQSQFK